MEIVNTAPLSEVSDELFPPSYDAEEDDDSSVLPDVDISREQLLSLLWVPVLLLLLIGMCAFGAAFFPKLHKMHKGCNCCFLSCALLILPFIFILSSIFFLLAVIGDDSCTTGTAMGETYLSDFGDEFCTQALKGTGTLTDCSFNWTVPERFGDDVNITISLNVLDTYNALFQKQCDTEIDPFENIALDLAEQVRPLPLQAVEKALESSDYDLRPSLENIVNSTAINYGQVLYDLIAETHVDGTQKVMTCESLSLVYADLQDTGCEGVVLPAVWLIASWYVVAWAICCCGVPASCVTLIKEKTVDDEFIAANVDEEMSSDEYEDEMSEYDDDDHDIGGVQLQTRLPQEEESTSSSEEEDDDDNNHIGASAPPLPLEGASLVRAPPGMAGASHISGNAPRPAKESWVATGARAYTRSTSGSGSGSGSYVDRSRGSARALGLVPGGGSQNDSRFQSTRNSRARDEALL